MTLAPHFIVILHRDEFGSGAVIGSLKLDFSHTQNSQYTYLLFEEWL